MRIRGCVVEYDLSEAARLLGIPPDELEHGVETGCLQYYYRLKAKGYRFHEASILANRERLTQRRQQFQRFMTTRKPHHHLKNIR